MRGEEMGLWIVLIDEFFVYQHWQDSLLTEQKGLTIQHEYFFNYGHFDPVDL